jgi:acyl-CoA thioesterase-2
MREIMAAAARFRPMDAREWLGLEPTHNPMRWVLPVKPGITTGHGFLFGGCGLGAAVSALEGSSGRPVVWATAQYLSYANTDSIMDVDVTIAVPGNRITQARAVGHVGDREILTVNAALGQREIPAEGQWAEKPDVPPPDDCPARMSRFPGTESIMDRIDVRLAILGDYVPFGIGQALGAQAGGNSLDNTLRVAQLVPTEWVLLDIRVHAVHHGFGHGVVHLWAEDGTLLATASQSTIVRFWDGALPGEASK